MVPERRECLLSALAGYLSFFIRGGIATPGLADWMLRTLDRHVVVRCPNRCAIVDIVPTGLYRATLKRIGLSGVGFDVFPFGARWWLVLAGGGW